MHDWQTWECDWGVRLFSITEIIDVLDWCSIMYVDDISDGYHVAVSSACMRRMPHGLGVGLGRDKHRGCMDGRGLGDTKPETS